LDNGVGDELILNLDGKEVRLSIVGLSISRLQNGFYVLLTVDGYEDLTGSLPGVTKATAHIDVIDMVEPDEYMERLKEKLSMAGYLAVETAATRDELVDAISILSVFLHGVMGAMFILASAGAATIIASLSAVDAGARQLEHAALLAIGMNSRRIIATYILQTVIALTIAVPPGYVASLLIAEVVAKRSAIAIGYIEYATSPLEVFSAATLLGALTLGAAAGWLALWLHLRGMRVADVIREA
ncbi:MAG TPA: FtsX-like permease family protein, partial [Pyrodictium sp.]|nr:FtsX-like permease family protein [Pyrodictium sp.]